jgi:hypothetical protein
LWLVQCGSNLQKLQIWISTGQRPRFVSKKKLVLTLPLPGAWKMNI